MIARYGFQARYGLAAGSNPAGPANLSLAAQATAPQARPRTRWLCLLLPSGVEAGKITIGLGILRPAQSLTIFNDVRTATRLPGRARLRVSLLFLRRLRRSGANDAGAINAEARRLAGSRRKSGGDGRRLGCCRGSGGLRRICCVSGASMVHRPCILLRGRILLCQRGRIPGGNNEQGTQNSAHFKEPRGNEMEHQPTDSAVSSRRGSKY